MSGFLSERSRDIIAVVGLALSIIQVLPAIRAWRTRAPSDQIGLTAALWRLSLESRFVAVFLMFGASAIALFFEVKPVGGVFLRGVIAAVIRNVFLAVCAIFIAMALKEHYSHLLRRYWLVVWALPALLMMGLASIRFAVPGFPPWLVALADVEMVGMLATLFVAFVFTVGDRLNSW